LDVGEPIERDEIDFFRAAQVCEIGLREDEIRLDSGAKIGVSISNIRGSVARGPKLKEA